MTAEKMQEIRQALEELKAKHPGECVSLNEDLAFKLLDAAERLHVENDNYKHIVEVISNVEPREYWTKDDLVAETVWVARRFLHMEGESK